MLIHLITRLGGKKMIYEALDISKYVIEQFNKKGHGISNLKLQKVLYYVQMKSLIDSGDALIIEQFEAWRHGPVIAPLYSKFKKYISSPIDIKDQSLDNCSNLDKSYIPLIDEVIEKTINVDPWDLVEKTHETSPWKDNYAPGCNFVIPKSEIKCGEFNI